MPAQKEARDTETGRIVMFPARHTLAKKAKSPETAAEQSSEYRVADLRKFEDGAEPDDYGHRMMINVAAFAFIVLLTLAGIWIVEEFAALRKHQDCVLMGRKFCGEHHIRSNE